MPRIEPIQKKNADAKAAQLLDNVSKMMGSIPNIVATMANSPAVANAYLSFSQSLAAGLLSARLREQIALVVGEANSCGYCVSAHTALGRRAGLTADEALAARRGRPSDEKERVAIDFAHRIVRERGFVSDVDLKRVREAGYNDGEIVEVIANVALNMFTNYFNHVAETEIDFPVAPELSLA
ncbi:MAG: carboxymuconolactone decarboxylase family protein [bacterium]|nr:carboxymuconolactone decarboxylase family protein [bacterium]